MYNIGIDLGGTNIVASVVDDKYNIIATGKTPTAVPRSAEEIFDDGIQDYGPDDAPGYAPESVGVKAKERDRSVIIRFWMMSPAGYYYAENKGVAYKEYFISVYDNP